jgi:hypothetical protein
MRFQTYRRLRRSALAAVVLVPLMALGAMFLPADANDGKLKEPGGVQASWLATTNGVTTRPYRAVWSPTQTGRNMPTSYRGGAVIIQRLSSKGWKSGMMLTPAGARDLARQIVGELRGTLGSIQIYNHSGGDLNATNMHFKPRDAYGVAYHLLVAAEGH